MKLKNMNMKTYLELFFTYGLVDCCCFLRSREIFRNLHFEQHVQTSWVMNLELKWGQLWTMVANSSSKIVLILSVPERNKNCDDLLTSYTSAITDFMWNPCLIKQWDATKMRTFIRHSWTVIVIIVRHEDGIIKGDSFGTWMEGKCQLGIREVLFMLDMIASHHHLASQVLYVSPQANCSIVFQSHFQSPPQSLVSHFSFFRYFL